MLRYISWLAVAIASAFLVVASAAFSLSAIAPLAFAISIGTLVVAVILTYLDRESLPSFLTALAIAGISVWTIVASVVFSQSTVQNLTLAAALAISGLAVVGLTVHEVSHERAARSRNDGSSEHEGRLAAAA
jgi:hypothetical protein